MDDPTAGHAERTREPEAADLGTAYRLVFIDGFFFGFGCFLCLWYDQSTQRRWTARDDGYQPPPPPHFPTKQQFPFDRDQGR